jgi:hypothetical protein
MAHINDLPDELLVMVFSFLPCSVAGLAARIVNGRWRRVLGDTRSANKTPCVSGADLGNTTTWSRAAAAAGHLLCLRHAHESGHVWGRGTSTAAAAGGHLDCLRYAVDNGCNWNRKASYAAARNGHVDCLDYTLGKASASLVSDVSLCAEAAAGGHVDVLEWLRARGYWWDTHTFAAAAAHGHLDALVFLWPRDCPQRRDAKAIAASRGHLDCLRFLHEKEECSPDRRYIISCDIYDVDCLTFMRDNGYPWTPSAFCALYSGTRRALARAPKSRLSPPPSLNGFRNRDEPDLDARLVAMVREATAKSRPSVWAMIEARREAAAVGCTPFLRFMDSLYPGARDRQDICEAAARGGHIETLRYAHGAGWLFLPSTKLVAEVAGRGHLDVMRYLDECNWSTDGDACRAAAAGGHVEVLAYLRRHVFSNGWHPWCRWDEKVCLKAAASGGHLNVLRYARKHEQCQWFVGLSRRAAAGGHIRCLRYLCETGCLYDAKTYAGAVGHQRRACCHYLDQIGCPKSVP